jgi:O-antigen/teichoic acid export membrane protein
VSSGTISVSRSAGSDATTVLTLGILATAIGFPTSIIVARTLGPEGKGVVALASTVAGYSTTMLGLGVDVAMVHFSGRAPETARSLARMAVRLGVLLGVLAAVGGAVLLLTVYRDRIPDPVMPWALLLVALGPVWLVTAYFQSIVIGIGRLVEVSVVQFLNALLTLVGAVVLVVGLGFGSNGWLATLGLVFVVSGLLTLVISLRAGVVPSAGDHGERSYAEVVGYGMRAYFGTLLQGLNYRLDFFLVAFFLPISQAGLYSIAVAATEILWVVPNNLGSVLMQRAARLPQVESDRLTQAVTRLTSLFLIVSSAVLAFVARPLVTWIFGSAFRGSVTPLLLLLPGTWALGLWKNVTNDLSGRGQPQSKAISAGLSAVATVLLDLLLIPKFGIDGAAVASSIAYMLAFGVSLVLYEHATGTGPLELIVPRPEDLSLLLATLRRRQRRRGPGAGGTTGLPEESRRA